MNFGRLKILGIVIATNGEKRKCSLCHRKHGRSFICKNEAGERFYFGSGCVQKVGVSRLELASVLSKVTVQSARLSYEMQKGFFDSITDASAEVVKEIVKEKEKVAVVEVVE